MWGNTKITKRVGMEYIITKMAINTKENGKMELYRVRVHIFAKMERSTKGNGRMENGMAQVDSSTIMVLDMRESLGKDKWMVMAYFIILMVISMK